MTTPLSISPSSPPIPNSFILGLSGVSSSGKTTIATHLHSIFSSPPEDDPLCDVTLVHADDFYLPEASLPFHAGHRDWDCAAALDLPALCATLHAWLHRGEPIPARPRQGVLLPTPTAGDGGPVTTGEPNGDSDHDDELSALAHRLRCEIRHRLTTTSQPQPQPLPRLLILDGFLLFPSPPLPSLLPAFQHIKILLRASHAATLARRLARPAYVTLDGFWADPPGYFDHVVWPHYVESHGRYFEKGDVEGDVEGEVCKREGVVVGPMEEGLSAVLEWVVDVVRGRMGV